MIDRQTIERASSVSVISATNTTKPYIHLHLADITSNSFYFVQSIHISRLFIKELYKYPIKLLREQILTTGKGVYTNGNLRDY